MGFGIFSEGVLALERMGIADVMLPFFLIFALVFAILQKVEPFGEKMKRIHVVIALVMGFSVIIPHVLYSGSRFDVVPIINASLPRVAVVIVALVMMLLLLGLLTGKSVAGEGLAGYVAIGAVLIVLYIFGAAAGWFGGLPYWIDDPQTIAVVVTILIFGLVMKFLMSEEEEGSDKEKFFDWLGKRLE